ncbi:MAG: site-specific integrase [Clostridia bacterium]|nr:site-specific integrase [Clostridia bacterium]
MAKYRIRVQIAVNDDGTPVYKQIQADSQNALNDRIVKTYIESGRIWEFMNHPEISTDKETITFGEYVENWLNVYKANQLKPATMATYKKHLHAHVLPAFGKRDITSITTEDIQLFLNERKHLAKKTLSSMRHFMGGIFKDAVEDGLIESDPTASRRISIPSTKAFEREALPLEVFKEIMGNLDLLQPHDKRMLVLMMFTGMRRGEVLGLRWEDIDMDHGLIHIQRNVTHSQGNKPIIGTTKSKSGKRDIPLDGYVIECLTPMESKGFIFGGNEPITMTTYNNTMKRIRKTIDLHGATAHVFRHSYLTYMAGEETDMKTLQSIAGHSTISMTMDRYAHAQPQKIIAAGKKMHALLAG